MNPAPQQHIDTSLLTAEHPCTGELLQPEPLVLLHGWGSDSRIWQQLLPLLSVHLNVISIDLPGFGRNTTIEMTTLNELLEQRASVMPERCSVLGWSLGGMLATAFTAHYPGRINGLITLASNASFVQQKGWKTAMPQSVFEEFCQFFQQQPEPCLKRFHGLQCKGDQHEKTLLKTLRGHFNNPGGESWQRALQLLGEIDNRHNLRQITVPGLHILGEQDALVPDSAAQAINRLNSHQQTLVLENTGHLAQLSCPQRLADAVVGFLARNRYHLDKQRVAESFSRAAKSYDSAARLQRQVGQQLIDQLPANMSPRVVVDLGCGTGYFTSQLAERYPDAVIIGLDLAPGMLNYARSHRTQKAEWLCADAELLPLADGSADLIFSSLALQWCEQLPLLAKEINRVLNAGGLLTYTSLVEGTLAELKAAWSAVDHYVHVNRFYPAQAWRSVFSEQGFDIERFLMDDSVLEYADLKQLTQELKGLGAHNINSGQNPGLTGRKQIQALKEGYEKFRSTEGWLPATWRVIRCQARKNDATNEMLSNE